MTETKYGKHILREPSVLAAPEFGGAKVFGYDDRDNIGVTYEYHCINNVDDTVTRLNISFCHHRTLIKHNVSILDHNFNF